MTINSGVITTNTFSARRLLTLLVAALTVAAVSLGFAAQANAITSSITASTSAKNLIITGDGYTSTVPVTVKCATNTTVTVSVVVRQEQGTDALGFPAVTNAFGSETVACGPTAATYQIPVQVPFGGLPLQPGKANLTVDAADCDPNTSECTYSNRVSKKVKLTY